jgi:hypothetical protein
MFCPYCKTQLEDAVKTETKNFKVVYSEDYGSTEVSVLINAQSKYEALKHVFEGYDDYFDGEHLLEFTLEELADKGIIVLYCEEFHGNN